MTSSLHRTPPQHVENSHSEEEGKLTSFQLKRVLAEYLSGNMGDMDIESAPQIFSPQCFFPGYGGCCIVCLLDVETEEEEGVPLCRLIGLAALPAALPGP